MDVFYLSSRSREDVQLGVHSDFITMDQLTVPGFGPCRSHRGQPCCVASRTLE